MNRARVAQEKNIQGKKGGKKKSWFTEISAGKLKIESGPLFLSPKRWYPAKFYEDSDVKGGGRAGHEKNNCLPYQRKLYREENRGSANQGKEIKSLLTKGTVINLVLKHKGGVIKGRKPKTKPRIWVPLYRPRREGERRKEGGVVVVGEKKKEP